MAGAAHNFTKLSSLMANQLSSAKLGSVRIRRNSGRLKAVCLLVVVVWLMRMAVYVKPSLSPMYGMRIRSLDTEARNIWTDYIMTHPADVDDRYGFKEMGFRAQAYAELARTHQIARLEELESKLWSFAPGATDIRIKSLQLATPLHHSYKRPSLTTSSVEATVKNRLKKNGRLAPNETSTLLAAAQLEDEARGGKRRGIVMAVNRQNALAAVQTIKVIRELHGCLLPVEIYHHLDDELPAPLRDMFNSLGRVSIIDIDHLPEFNYELEDDGGRYPASKETWERQSLGLLASSFHEIIVIDPYVVFVQNPSLLFSHPSLTKTGTLFFRSKAKPVDRGSQYLVSFLKRQIDQGSPSKQLADSAFFSHKIGSRMDMDVVVLDKSRPEVLAALFMNAWMRRNLARTMLWSTDFKTMTEALWMAFELSEFAYAFENTWPGAVGRFEGDEDESPLLCSPRTVQFLSPQEATEQLSRRYFSLFQSGSAAKQRGRISEAKQNAAGEAPFWFHGGYLEHGKQIETYYMPNVYARNMPPYTTVDEDGTGADNCLYGATLNKLKRNTFPSSLEDAVDIAHEAFKSEHPTLKFNAAIPALGPDVNRNGKKKAKS